MSVHAEDGNAGKPEVQFAQVPIDLLHAVCTELGGTRGAVLADVLAARYGVSKAPETTIDRKAIARVAGSTPHAVTVAVGRLRESNILARSEGGVRLNGRYSTWAGMDPERAREIRRTARPKGSRRRDHAGHKAETFGHTAETAGHTGVTGGSHSGDQKSRPCDPPLKREEIYIPPSGGEIYAPPPAGEDSQSTGAEPESAPSLGGIPVEERRALAAEADRMSAGAWHLGLVGTALDAGIRPDVLREAMARAKLRGNMRWGYVLGIARDFAANGIDKPPQPDRPQRHRPGSPEALAEWKARRDAAWGIVPEREAVA